MSLEQFKKVLDRVASLLDDRYEGPSLEFSGMNRDEGSPPIGMA